jgi:hypothetical protein
MAEMSTSTTTGSIERDASGYYMEAHSLYAASVEIGAKHYDRRNGDVLTVENIVPGGYVSKMYGSVTRATNSGL